MRKSALHAVPVVALLLSLALSSPVLNAQNTMGGKGDPKEALAKLEKMSAELQLTPEQKEKIKPILMQEAPKMRALKQNTTMPKLQKARAMHDISQETDGKLKPILTPDQYTKWEGMRAEERQQMLEKMEKK